MVMVLHGEGGGGGAGSLLPSPFSPCGDCQSQREPCSQGGNISLRKEGGESKCAEGKYSGENGSSEGAEMALIYEDKNMTMTDLLDNSLLCEEVLELPKTPEGKQQQQQQLLQQQQQHQGYPEIPPTVRAEQDVSQVRDGRVLENLLRNEEKYLPPQRDYMDSVQHGGVTAPMRRLVAEWMLDVVHEQRSPPEVFALAVNVMDRFLGECRVEKSQLQLLGSVCVLVASKMREPCPIPGQTLVAYTDHSITTEELKEWELLVLYKLGWEMTAVTPLDYLDHALPRLCLEDDSLLSLSAEEARDLRERTEAALVLAATRYQFSYVSPSTLAAAAALASLEWVRPSMLRGEAAMREVRLRLQAVTHTSNDQLEECCRAIRSILPPHLTSPSSPQRLPPSPDSTTALTSPISTVTMTTPTKAPNSAVTLTSSNEATPVPSSAETSPDLACRERLEDDSVLGLEEDYSSSSASELFCSTASAAEAGEEAGSDSASRSSSPLSVAEIFKEFNAGVLKSVFEQGEQAMEPGSYSILVS